MKRAMLAYGSAAAAALFGAVPGLPDRQQRLAPIPRSSRSQRAKKHGAVPLDYMSRRARRRARGREKEKK
jgi:hypothetical protein